MHWKEQNCADVRSRSAWSVP